MIHHTAKAGFTVVELLVALTVAAALLISAHQLYTVIIRDSGEVRQRARASNIAYDYLQRYTAMAPSACSATTALNNSHITPDPEGLADVYVSVYYSCPRASAMPTLTKVRTVVTYSNGGEVTHARYTTP